MNICITKPCELKLNAVVQTLQVGTCLNLPDDKAKKLIDAGYAKPIDAEKEASGLWRWFVVEADLVFRSSPQAADSWNLHKAHKKAADDLCKAGNISAARVELEKALTALQCASITQPDLLAA